MLIGYARVSTRDQNLDIQLKALEEAGCEKIYTDKISGNKKDRIGLTKLLSYIRPGDTLVVYKLSRLSRSLMGIISIIGKLKEQNIDIKILTQNVDTRTPEGKLFFHMIAAFNEFQRELIVDNINAGLQVAKDKGIKLGRPSIITEEKRNLVMAMLKDVEHYPFISDVIKASGMTRPTFYRHFSTDLIKNIREN